MTQKRSRKSEVNKSAWILRGSIVRLRRKCGHDNCRCAQGALHETWVLSVNVGGRTQLVTLRDEDLPMVEAALARYRKAREKLEEQVQETMVMLREWKKRKRELSG